VKREAKFRLYTFERKEQQDVARLLNRNQLEIDRAFGSIGYSAPPNWMAKNFFSSTHTETASVKRQLDEGPDGEELTKFKWSVKQDSRYDVRSPEKSDEADNGQILNLRTEMEKLQALHPAGA